MTHDEATDLRAGMTAINAQRGHLGLPAFRLVRVRTTARPVGRGRWVLEGYIWGQLHRVYTCRRGLRAEMRRGWWEWAA